MNIMPFALVCVLEVLASSFYPGYFWVVYVGLVDVFDLLLDEQ